MQVPGCFSHLLALGKGLIVEHVGVAALFAKILGKRVAGPHRLQARIFFELRLGDDRARIGLGRRVRQRFAAAEAGAHLVDRASIVVVLQRKVLAPHGRDLPCRRSARRRDKTDCALSCLRSKMFISKATPTMVASTAAPTMMKNKRRRRRADASLPMISAMVSPESAQLVDWLLSEDDPPSGDSAGKRAVRRSIPGATLRWRRQFLCDTSGTLAR